MSTAFENPETWCLSRCFPCTVLKNGKGPLWLVGGLAGLAAVASKNPTVAAVAGTAGGSAALMGYLQWRNCE